MLGEVTAWGSGKRGGDRASEEEEGEIKNYERRRKLNRMKKELQRKADREDSFRPMYCWVVNS